MNSSNSILDTVKQLSRVAPEDTDFDLDFIIGINTVFSDLNQLGVGPERVFQIEDNKATWDEFTGGNDALNAVRSYMVNRMRLLFDPPTTSFAITAVEKQVKEHEWRLMEAAASARTSVTSFTSVTSAPLGSSVIPDTLTP